MTTIAVAESIEQFRERFSNITREVGRRIVGHDEVVGLTVTSLLAGGHVLLEGIPGVGKTSLVHTLADVLHLTFSRIQFTPDLMPADIVGTNIIVEEGGERRFRFQPGASWWRNPRRKKTSLVEIAAVRSENRTPLFRAGRIAHRTERDQRAACRTARNLGQQIRTQEP